MSQKSTNLNVQTVLELSSIFDQKKWPRDDNTPGGDSKLFEKFCTLLTFMKREEQELILTITKKFDRFTYFDYPNLIDKSINKIDQQILNRHQEIFLVPLITSEDIAIGKVKSGVRMVYDVKHIILPKYIDRSRQRVTEVESVNKLSINHADRNDALILFIDDFVGTGITACNVLMEYCKNFVENDKVLIVCIVALEEGISSLNDIGFDVISALVRKRGISDSDLIEDKEKALSIMDNIESRLKIKQKYRRGFGKSEALIKMIRTPNNTFPVYWCPETSGGKDWPAPFPRY